MLDVRGSYTILGYKRIEAEFTAPRLFHRRGSLSVLGGWREATQAAFYGLGMGTSLDDRTDFDFQQPYGSGTLTLWPTRRLLMLRGGLVKFNDFDYAQKTSSNCWVSNRPQRSRFDSATLEVTGWLRISKN